MYIGCNWSDALKYLIRKELVKVDYIKTGAYGNFNKQFPTMRSMRPILLHGLGYSEHVGMKSLDTIDFDRANRLIKECGSPHYGVHLAIKSSDMYQYMSYDDIHKHMSERIQIFKKNISVPLLLENTPDSPQEHLLFDHYPFITPEQINKLLIDNDVSFLLDLTHAKITANYHGWNVRDYIRALSLNRVAEIHVNGSGHDRDGFPSDTHQAMEEEDYDLLEWVLCYSKPKIVTLEYNGTEAESNEKVKSSLREQLDRIQSICNPK